MATEMDKMTDGPGYERLGRRRLKLVDVIAQSVGLIGPVFSAAFLIPLIAGFGFSGEGAGIATPFAVILATIGVLALGWIVAQYAKRVHAAGSLYDYVTMGLGSRVGGWAGWVYYGGTLLLASAIAVLVGWFLRDNVLPAFEIDPIMPSWAWSLIYVGLVFLILAAGVQISTRVQLILALVSAAVVLAFFIDVIIHAPENSLKAFNPAEAPSYTGILFGVLYGVLIFVGFEIGGEPRRGSRAAEAGDPSGGDGVDHGRRGLLRDRRLRTGRRLRVRHGDVPRSRGRRGPVVRPGIPGLLRLGPDAEGLARGRAAGCDGRGSGRRDRVDARRLRPRAGPQDPRRAREDHGQRQPDRGRAGRRDRVGGVGGGGEGVRRGVRDGRPRGSPRRVRGLPPGSPRWARS